MKLKKVPNVLAKIFINFTYWACVAITFPVVGLMAKAFGYSSELNPKTFFEITKYFDSKLIVGLGAACLILYGITKLTNEISEKIKSDLDRDMPHYVIDEIFSQLIGIGSVINVITITLYLLKDHKGLVEGGAEGIAEYWWLGFAIWIVAIGMNWLGRKDQVVN